MIIRVYEKTFTPYYNLYSLYFFNIKLLAMEQSLIIIFIKMESYLHSKIKRVLSEIQISSGIGKFLEKKKET